MQFNWLYKKQVAEVSQGNGDVTCAARWQMCSVVGSVNASDPPLLSQ